MSDKETDGKFVFLPGQLVRSGGQRVYSDEESAWIKKMLDDPPADLPIGKQNSFALHDMYRRGEAESPR